MTFAERLNELRLLHMRALTGDDNMEPYHVVCHFYSSGYAGGSSIGILTEPDDGGWNFFADERGDDVSYQTLLWINKVEDDLNKSNEWDMNNPDHLKIAVQAYKDATRDMLTQKTA